MSTGRVLYAKYSNVLDFMAKCIAVILPHKFRIRLLTVSRNISGKIGIGIRYILIKTLAKSCGRNVSIKQYVFLENIQNISFGNNVSIHPFCYMEGAGGIEIGNDVSLAHATSVLSVNHTWSERNNPIKYNPIEYAPVKIFDDVWIGCGCRILAGVTIHSRAIIAAGAVVTKDVESDTLVGGIPAKYIKKI